MAKNNFKDNIITVSMRVNKDQWAQLQAIAKLSGFKSVSSFMVKSGYHFAEYIGFNKEKMIHGDIDRDDNAELKHVADKLGLDSVDELIKVAKTEWTK